MNVGDYVAGSVALGLTVLPWPLAATRVQRRIGPAWEPATALLGRCIVAISGVLVVAELMGLAGELRRWPLAIVSAALAGVVGVITRPQGGGPDWPRLRVPSGAAERLQAACIVICVMAISVVLLGRDAKALHTGPNDLDSLHYHLTQSAQMVQTHSLTHLHQTSSSDGTLYYPFNVELLDAVTMLGPHPDLGTFGLNLLFGWLALLACWVIGARFRAGPAAVAGGAVVLALPIVAGASSGPGLNDIPGMAFLLAGIGLLLVAGLPRGDRPRRGWLAEIAVAGLALGLAAGTKLPLVAPVLLVAVGAIALARQDRMRSAGVLAVTGLLTGGFWYLRDWAIVGSPQPSLNIHIGSHGLTHVPYPEVAPYSFTVAHYLGNFHVIRHWFVPGLQAVWTDAWPVVAVLIAVGAIIAIVGDRVPARRMLGVVTVLGFGAYLVTPTSAIGPPGQPILFGANTRYALPVFVVALVLFATAEVFGRITVVITIGLTGFTIVLLALSKVTGKISTAPGLAAALIVAVAATWCWVLRERLPRVATGRVIAGLLAIAVVVIGGVVQRDYVTHRYAGPGDELFRYVGSLSHQRIGLTGYGLQYPFYGPSFTNQVNYVGVTSPDKSFGAPTTCADLVQVLAASHDDYLVIEPLQLEHTDQLMAWTAVIPGVHEVLSTARGTVYRLPPVVTASGCPAPG